jgi:pyruvate dehydrogenase E1 component alpha subunit
MVAREVWGGSMHMIDKSVNFIGSTPVLGSITPIAAGVSFEQKYNNNGGITVAFIGDGASEEGVVYETINMSALFKLPFLLVIENNLHSVNSRLKERRGEEHSVEKVVSGLGVKYLKADGNDYLDVFSKAKSLIDDIRKGKPAVLECVTYRHMAHSAPIFDEGYREEDILERRLEKDCLKRMKQYLLDNKVSEDELIRLEKEIQDVVRESIEFALSSAYPPKENLYNNLYA